MRGRVARFAVVGASALVVNEIAMAAAVEWLTLATFWAGLVATQVSTAWNFAASELWAFADHGAERSRGARLVRYVAVNEAVYLARGPVMVGLVALGLHYLAANGLTLVVAAVARFILADRWIWKP